MEKNRKIYYSMGEVSEMFDVNPSLIRFWEQKFDILKPHKNKKGNRMFTPRDVENLKLIYHLVKEKGMTLSGAEKRLKENREGLERNLEIIDKLQGIKSLLLEIKQELKTDNSGYEEILIENDDLGSNSLSGSDKMTATIATEGNVSDNIFTEKSENVTFSTKNQVDPISGLSSINIHVEEVRSAQESLHKMASDMQPLLQFESESDSDSQASEEKTSDSSVSEEKSGPRIIEQTLF